MPRPFRQVDVFTTTPYHGNPVAVVLDAEGLTEAQMQRFAHWTNLSETTYVLPPSVTGADYRVRIFTPFGELPFAGHPTLGTCHAWLAAAQGSAAPGDRIVQECAAGLVEVRLTADGLAFAAPPQVRSGPVEDALVERLAAVLGIERAGVVDAQWVDNGPGWVALLLADADAVLALRPGLVDGVVGVVGPYPSGSPHAFEVRAFFAKDGATVEDPVTGSLNASLAQWLLGTGRATRAVRGQPGNRARPKRARPHLPRCRRRDLGTSRTAAVASPRPWNSGSTIQPISEIGSPPSGCDQIATTPAAVPGSASSGRIMSTQERPAAVSATSPRTLASIPSRGNGPPSSAIITGSQRIRT